MNNSQYQKYKRRERRLRASYRWRMIVLFVIALILGLLAGWILNDKLSGDPQAVTQPELTSTPGPTWFDELDLGTAEPTDEPTQEPTEAPTQEPTPVATEEPGAQPETTAEPAAEPVGLAGEPFVGTWRAERMVSEGQEYDLSATPITMTLNADGTAVTESAETQTTQAVWSVEGGVAMLEGGEMSLTEDGSLCAQEDGVEIYFVREGEAVASEETAEPAAEETPEATEEPTAQPAEETTEPTAEPSVEPTQEATAEPTAEPTPEAAELGSMENPVPVGEAYEMNLELLSDGSPRTDANVTDYFQVPLTFRVTRVMDTQYYADNYSADYMLKGNESGCELEVTLGACDGLEKVLMQNAITVVLQNAAGEIVPGYQFTTAEIGGETDSTVVPGNTAVIYKRYDAGMVSDLAYLTVSYYQGGSRKTVFFSLEQPDMPEATVAPEADASAAEPEVTAEPAQSESYTIGDSGEAVSQIQSKLIALKYLTGSPDGKFGKWTAEAVKAAQKDFGLEPTGIADAAFLEILNTK